MTKNMFTPKKKQLTKNKNEINSKHACGGKSGDVIGARKLNIEKIVFFQSIGMIIFGAILVCLLLHDQLSLLTFDQLQSEALDLCDGLSDWIIRICNHYSRSRLQSIYYSPVTTDRRIICEKLVSRLTNVTSSYIESVNGDLNALILRLNCFFSSGKWLNSISLGVRIIALILSAAITMSLLVSLSAAKIIIFTPILIIIVLPTVLILNNCGTVMSINNIYEYTNWLIEETFRLRNVYIDSNYFLTNDSTKGIEKFTDLVVPWFVDNGGVDKWGLWFSMLDQVDQIREREKYFIMNDLNNLSTPKKRLCEGDDGKLSTMLWKPAKRIDALLDILLDIGDARSSIMQALSSKSKINSFSVFDSKAIVSSIWDGKYVSPSGHKVIISHRLTDPAQQDRPISLKFELDEMLDSVLPQKNNIISDSVQNNGALSDRKQIVFRANNVGFVDGSPLKSKNRRPDTTKSTNYIFEKTLQNERTREYSKKTYLNNYFKLNPSIFTTTNHYKKCNLLHSNLGSIKPVLRTNNSDLLRLAISPHDYFLDKITRQYVLNSNSKISEYSDNLYFSYSPFSITISNSPTGIVSQQFSDIAPFLSQNKQLRLGVHNYYKKNENQNESSSPKLYLTTLSQSKLNHDYHNTISLNSVSYHDNQSTDRLDSLNLDLTEEILYEHDSSHDFLPGSQDIFPDMRKTDWVEKSRLSLWESALVVIKSIYIHYVVNSIEFESHRRFISRDCNYFTPSRFTLFNVITRAYPDKRTGEASTAQTKPYSFTEVKKNIDTSRPLQYFIASKCEHVNKIINWIKSNTFAVFSKLLLNIPLCNNEVMYRYFLLHFEDALFSYNFYLMQLLLKLKLTLFKSISIFLYEWDTNCLSNRSWYCNFSESKSIHNTVQFSVKSFLWQNLLRNGQLLLKLICILDITSYNFYKLLFVYPTHTLLTSIWTLIVPLNLFSNKSNNTTNLSNIFLFIKISQLHFNYTFWFVISRCVDMLKDCFLDVCNGKEYCRFDQIELLPCSKTLPAYNSSPFDILIPNINSLNCRLLTATNIHATQFFNSFNAPLDCVFRSKLNNSILLNFNRIADPVKARIKQGDIALVKDVCFEKNKSIGLTEYRYLQLPNRICSADLNKKDHYFLVEYNDLRNINRIGTLSDFNRFNIPDSYLITHRSGFIVYKYATLKSMQKQFYSYSAGISDHHLPSFYSWVTAHHTPKTPSVEFVDLKKHPQASLLNNYSIGFIESYATSGVRNINTIDKKPSLHQDNNYSNIGNKYGLNNEKTSDLKINNGSTVVFNTLSVIKVNEFCKNAWEYCSPFALKDIFDNIISILFRNPEFYEFDTNIIRKKLERKMTSFVNIITDKSADEKIVESSINRIKDSELCEYNIVYNKVPITITSKGEHNHQNLNRLDFIHDSVLFSDRTSELRLNQTTTTVSRIRFKNPLKIWYNRIVIYLETNILFLSQNKSLPVFKQNLGHIKVHQQDFDFFKYILLFTSRFLFKVIDNHCYNIINSYSLLVIRLEEYFISVVLDCVHNLISVILIKKGDFTIKLASAVSTPLNYYNQQLVIKPKFYTDNLYSNKSKCNSMLFLVFDGITIQRLQISNIITTVSLKTKCITHTFYYLLKYQSDLVISIKYPYHIFSKVGFKDLLLLARDYFYLDCAQMWNVNKLLSILGLSSSTSSLLTNMFNYNGWGWTSNNLIERLIIKIAHIFESASRVFNVINYSFDRRLLYYWFIMDRVDIGSSFMRTEVYKFDNMLSVFDYRLYSAKIKKVNANKDHSQLDAMVQDCALYYTKKPNFWSDWTKLVLSNISGNIINASAMRISSEQLDNYLYNNLISEFESFIESKCQLIWLEICIIFDFVAELATEIDFEPISNPIENIYNNFLETLNEYIVGDELSEERDILGLTVNMQIGDDPGNEFTTFNDFLDVPNDIETFLGLDSVDLAHEAFGLDSPELGEISPSFDITIPVKSLWLVGVFYYNPITGGVISVDIAALFDFFKVLYLDSRLLNLATLFDMLDLRLIGTAQPITILLRLRLHYLIEDSLQLVDLIYINPYDYIIFGYLYLTFLFNYFGGTFPATVLIALLIVSKVASITESRSRRTANSDLTVVSMLAWSINYTLYRLVFHLIVNAFIFIRMSIASLILLTGAYFLSEGFHVFSVLRIIDSDQENLKFYGGQFFNLERDPFVEKHTPVDEVWDEFKYDSWIDTDWSREHFERDTTEIVGGNVRESGNLIELTGFAKKYEYPEVFELDDDDDYSSRALSTNIDQIHNRIPDESSYLTKFHNNTELEREFYREFEKIGQYVPGSTEWYNRAAEFSTSISESSVSDEVSSSILNESGDESTEELDGRRYDLLLFNTIDPVWLYNESLVLSHRQFRPDTLPSTGISINSQPYDLDLQTLAHKKRLMSINRISSLLSRNSGNLRLNPIQDMWDLDVSTDWGIEVDDQSFTSYGSTANNIDNWIDAYGDPITQVTTKSTNPAIIDSIPFSHVNNITTDDTNLYSNEKIILEKSIDLLKRVRLPLVEGTPIHTITGNEKSSWKYYGESLNYLDDEDSTMLEKIDKNDFSSRFSSDIIYDDEDGIEYYFDWLFWDLDKNSYESTIRKIIPSDRNELSLKSIRNRFYDFTKYDGDSFLGTFKENILKENKKQDISYLIENSLNKYSVFNANAFYTLSEDAPKSPVFGAYRNSVIVQKVSEMDVDAESRNKSQFFKGDPLGDENTELSPTTDPDDSSGEMWGSFENYYENGIKTNTSTESITYSDYSYKFKKKDYGSAYNTLTKLARTNNKITTKNTGVAINEQNTDIQNSDSSKNDPNALAESRNVDSLGLNRDYYIIGDVIFRKKVDYEVSRSFTEDYNILSLNSAIAKYYDFLNGKLLKKIKKLVPDNPYRLENKYTLSDLVYTGINKNLNREKKYTVESALVPDLLLNNLPHSVHQSSTPKKNHIVGNVEPVKLTNVLAKLNARSSISFTDDKNNKINKLFKKFKIDTSKYTFLRGNAEKRNISSPMKTEITITHQTIPGNAGINLTVSESQINQSLPSRVEEKLSDYINTFQPDFRSSINNSSTKNSNDDLINSHIFNTIIEDDVGFDNKLRLAFGSNGNSDSEVIIPRVLSTIQDTIDSGESKKFLSNYKKKKVSEFNENYSWDKIDPDDSVEDAEEGDLESHSYASWTHQHVVDYSKNPIFSSSDDSNMHTIVSNAPIIGMALNNIDFLAMGTLNLLKDAEQESFRNVSNAWIGGPNIPRSSKRSSLRQILDSANHVRDTTIESPDAQRGKKDSVALSNSTIEGSSIVEDVKIENLGGFYLSNAQSTKTNFDTADTSLSHSFMEMVEQVRTYSKPWGLNFNVGVRWDGTTPWDISDSLQEFGDLFSDSKYKIYNPKSKIVGLSKPIGLTVSSKTFNTKSNNMNNNQASPPNYLTNHNLSMYSEHGFTPSNISEMSKEAFDEFNFFDSKSDLSAGFNYIRTFLSNENSDLESSIYSPRKIVNNSSTYSEYEEPSLDDGDQAWLLDSENNQNWLVSSKFDSGVWQYNFISSSIEQKVIEQEYNSRFMPRNSAVLTSRDANNLLWKLKKKNKRVKINSLIRTAQESDDDESVQPIDYFKNDWHNMISSPTSIYQQDVNYFSDLTEEENSAAYSTSEIDNSWAISTINYLTNTGASDVSSASISDLIDEYGGLAEFKSIGNNLDKMQNQKKLNRDKRSNRVDSSDFSESLLSLSESLIVTDKLGRSNLKNNASSSMYDYVENSLLHDDYTNDYDFNSDLEQLVYSRSLYGIQKKGRLLQPKFIANGTTNLIHVPLTTQEALIDLYQIDDYSTDESDDIDDDIDVVDSNDDDDDRFPIYIHPSRVVNTPMAPSENVDSVFDSGFDSFDDYDSYLAQIDNVSDIAVDSDFYTANSELFVGDNDNVDFDEEDSSDYNPEPTDNYLSLGEDTSSDESEDEDDYSGFSLANTELGTEDDSSEYDDYLSNDGLDTNLSAVGAVAQDVTDITEDSFDLGGSGGSDGYIATGSGSQSIDESHHYISSDYEFDASYHPKYTNDIYSRRNDFNPSPFDEAIVSNSESEYEYEMSDQFSDNFDTEFIEFDRRSLRRETAEVESGDLEFYINSYLDDSSEELINLAPNSTVLDQEIEQSHRRHGSLIESGYSINEELIEFDEGADVDGGNDEYLRTDLGTETAFSIAQADSDVSVSSISDFIEADNLDDLQDFDDDSHDKEILIEHESEVEDIDFDWETRLTSSSADDSSYQSSDYDLSLVDEYDESVESTRDVDLEVATPVDYYEIVADNASKLRSQINNIDGDVDDTNNSDDTIYISDESDIGNYSDGGSWILPLEDYYPAQSTDWNFSLNSITRNRSKKIYPFAKNKPEYNSITTRNISINNMIMDTQQNSVSLQLNSSDVYYSDINIDIESGEQRSPTVTATTPTEVRLFTRSSHTPLIQPRADTIIWQKDLIKNDSWNYSQLDEYLNKSNIDVREPMSTGEHYLNNESKIIEDILLISHKKPGFFNSFNFNNFSLEPEAHEYQNRWDGGGRHKERSVDIIPDTKYKKPSSIGRLSSLSAEFDVKYKLISESRGVTNGEQIKKPTVKPLAVDSLFSGAEQDDSPDSTEFSDLIASIAVPTVKGIKITKKVINSTPELVSDYDLGYSNVFKDELDFDNKIIETKNTDFRVLRMRRRLNRLLSNSIIHKNRSKKEKVYNNGTRYFAYNDNLVPSPHIRSLSIDSNLFSKINSLRVYGSGRLQDFMYSPKISSILLSSDYLDINDETTSMWGGDYDELDDDDDDSEEDDVMHDEEAAAIDDQYEILDSDIGLGDDDDETYVDDEIPHSLDLKLNRNNSPYRVDSLGLRDGKIRIADFGNDLADTYDTVIVELDRASDVDAEEDDVNIDKTIAEFSSMPINTTHHLDEDRFGNNQLLPNSSSLISRFYENMHDEDGHRDLNSPIFGMDSSDYLSAVNYVGRRGVRGVWYSDDDLSYGEDSSSLEIGGTNDLRADYDDLDLDFEDDVYELDNGLLQIDENSNVEEQEDDETVPLHNAEEEYDSGNEEQDYDWEVDTENDYEEDSDIAGTGDSDPEIFPHTETKDQWLINLFENLIYDDERAAQYVDKFHKDKLHKLDHSIVSSFLAATQLEDISYIENDATMESISRGIASGNLFESVISFSPDDAYNVLGDYSADNSISAFTNDDQSEMWYRSLDDEYSETDSPKIGSDLDGDGSDMAELVDDYDDGTQPDYEQDDNEDWDEKSFEDEEDKSEGDPGGLDSLFQFDRDKMKTQRLIEQDWPTWGPVGGYTLFTEVDSWLNYDKFYSRIGNINSKPATVSKRLLRTNSAKLEKLDPIIGKMTPSELKEYRSKDYDYLKEYLLDQRVSENYYISGDDDDDGDIENELEDNNNSTIIDGIEEYENDVQESDFISGNIGHDIFDTESAVDLLSDYFSTKIVAHFNYESQQSEIDAGEVVNGESNLLSKSQDSVLVGLEESQYKKNLFQKLTESITLNSTLHSDENTVVPIKSVSEKTQDSFILTKSALKNSSNKLDYSNTALLARRTNEEASTILPRIKWGSLKKYYIYQFNNNERFVSTLQATKENEKFSENSDKIGIQPLSSYVFDNLYTLDSEISSGGTVEEGDSQVVNIIINNKKNKANQWRGFENAWGESTKGSISPIKILKSSYISTEKTKTESHLVLPQVDRILPTVWDLDSPHVGDTVTHSESVVQSVSNDNSNSEDGLLDMFSEIDEILVIDQQPSDDEYDIDEDSVFGDEFNNDFSYLRENMETLSDYKDTTALPPELISGFISSLNNIDIQQVLSEVPKSPIKYPMEKFAAIGMGENDSDDLAIGTKALRIRDQLQYRKYLRSHTYSKGRLISNFSIYRKKLDRVGTQSGDILGRYNLSIFDTQANRRQLLDNANTGGYSNRVLRNNAVYRRSDELQLRTFGPDIQLNSLVWGYGKFDKSLDSNLNTEEDFGLYNGLGYPEIVEQNIYDESDWVEMAYGGSVFSSKFTDFIWKINESVGEDSEQDIAVNKRRIDELLWGDSDTDNKQINSSSLYKVLYVLSNISKFSDYKNIYKIPAGYNRFFSTNSQIHNDINSGSIKLTTDDYWSEHLENEEDPDLRKLITEKLIKDSFGTNIGPLGYEEGESLYDNRLLTRGWFPEKIIWDMPERSISSVGSDPSTLELISDYKYSFSHDMENYGRNPERESLKNIELNNNKILNIIDDIVEGSGIEEDIPYSPAHSEKIWHYLEFESRPNSTKLEERANNWLSLDKITEFEEEEHEVFGPDSDPTEAEGLEYGNFNILGLNDLISSTRVWSKLNYLGDLDHAEVPGTSLAIMENELYDNLRTDLSNFLNDQLPTDPEMGSIHTALPDPATMLFGGQDTYESKRPGFGEYINSYDNSRHMDQDFIPKERAKKLEKTFLMKESDRPSDEFSFAPTSNENIVFEPEWIVAGEGWLGATGSSRQSVTPFSIPTLFIDPTQSALFQPRGSHSIKIMDEGGENMVENVPYNSLSDFTTNRITRGLNNDSPAFPFLRSWAASSTGYASDNPPDDWWFDDKTMTDSPFSNDRITFPETSLNQRDLWWRSFETGKLTTSSNREIAHALFYDKFDSVRDFVVSYDYKLYGRSWMNPQSNTVPLKSYSFYNDTEINNFISMRDDDISHNSGLSNSFDNQLYGDYTYGLFVSSNTNFEGSLVFYSVKVRDFLYYLLGIAIALFTPLYLTIFSNTSSFLDQVYNMVHFKTIFYIFTVKGSTPLAIQKSANIIVLLSQIFVIYVIDLLCYLQLLLQTNSHMLAIVDSLLQSVPNTDEFSIVINILNKPLTNPIQDHNPAFFFNSLLKLFIFYTISIFILIFLI